ncbi:MAG: toxin-antitoxin system YwqK family antitoxin [Planctomycetota bacterium]
MLNGTIPEDEWTFYYEDGSLSSRVNYKNGNLVGPAIGWYPGGALHFSATYSGSNDSLRLNRWHYDGRPAVEIEFINAKLEGVVKCWSECGCINSYYSGKYQNDRKVRK